MMTSYLTTLDRPALESLGIQGFAYGYRDRVRFHELDALNHVNNAVYLKWFETVRVRYLQDYALSSYGAPGDPQLVVRRVTADYFAPVLQDQDYVVTARTTLVKPSSFFMEYGLFVGEQRIAAGEAVVVSLRPDGKARQNHKPEAVRKMLEIDRATSENL